MQSVILVTLIGTLTCGVGTGFGAFLATFFKKSNNHVISCIMGLAGGLMLSVVTFDLLPEAILQGGLYITLIGVLIGVVFVILADKFCSEMNFLKKYGKGVKAGLLLVLALSAHNFPEGLAIGSGFIKSPALGLELLLVIAMHDIPEGAAVAAPFIQTKLSRKKIVLIAIMTAIPTAIGAYIGAALGGMSKTFITLCLGFAGGTMLYIICEELIPGSKRLAQSIVSTLSILFGIILGLIICTSI